MTREESEELIRQAMKERTEAETQIRMLEVVYVAICVAIAVLVGSIVWDKKKVDVEQEEKCMNKGSYAAKDSDGNYLCVTVRTDD
jgi:hypothetical protein